MEKAISKLTEIGLLLIPAQLAVLFRHLDEKQGLFLRNSDLGRLQDAHISERTF